MTNKIDYTDNQLVITIDLESISHSGQSHPEHDPGVVILYRIKVDETYHEVRKRHMSAKEVIGLTGKTPSDFQLKFYKKFHGHPHGEFVHVDENQVIDFGTPGIERFITEAKIYHFQIGLKKYQTPHKVLTVRQILVDFAKVDPRNKTLAIKTQSGFESYSNLDEKISMENCPVFTLFDNDSTTVA